MPNLYVWVTVGSTTNVVTCEAVSLGWWPRPVTAELVGVSVSPGARIWRGALGTSEHATNTAAIPARAPARIIVDTRMRYPFLPGGECLRREAGTRMPCTAEAGTACCRASDQYIMNASSRLALTL